MLSVKKRYLLVISASIFLLFSAQSSWATMSARLAQNMSPISGMAMIAKKMGFFKKHGLNITVSGFTSGKQCLNAVIGGGADIATTAESPTTAAAMAHEPIAFLARMEISDLKTLVSVASGIKTIADLKGKRIAFTAGTGSEVYTMTLLKKAGLTKNDVKLVNLRPQDMIPALATGSIDAYDTWEPHISNGKKALGKKVMELDTKGVYAETFNIVVMKDYLAKHPKLIDSFLRALIDAETWMHAHKQQAITIIAKTSGMKRATLANIWFDFNYHLVIDNRQLEILKKHSEWRLESGNHPPNATMPDFSKVIFAGPLKKIDPSRVTATGY